MDVALDQLAVARLVADGADDGDVLAQACDELGPLVLERVDRSGPSASAISSTLRANAWNSVVRETGSVSQPTAAIVPRPSAIR